MSLFKIILLLPLSLLWNLASSLKNWAYDVRLFKARKLPVKVLSIGNITMGGVGKTPLVQELCRKFSEKYKVAIVVRSYKADLRTPAKVDLSLENAIQIFGDEAVLLARSLPEISIFSGPQKLESAEYALQQIPGLGLILIDDGFQHRKLYRECDYVVLDATEPLKNYFCFPMGRARESWSQAVDRASGFIMTRTNLVEPEVLAKLRSKLPAGKPSFTTRLEFDELEEWFVDGRPKTAINPRELKNLNPLLLTGIGRPEQVERFLFVTWGYKFESLRLPDHHRYTVDDFAFSSSVVLTTEKDALKIVELPWNSMKATSLKRLLVLKTKYVWDDELEIVSRKMEECLFAV